MKPDIIFTVENLQGFNLFVVRLLKAKTILFFHC